MCHELTSELVNPAIANSAIFINESSRPLFRYFKAPPKCNLILQKITFEKLATYLSTSVAILVSEILDLVSPTYFGMT